MPGTDKDGREEGSGACSTETHYEPIEPRLATGSAPVLVEIICERVHCVLYDYAINTVDMIVEKFGDQIEIQTVIRQGDRDNAEHFLDLCKRAGRMLQVPTILINGEAIFTTVPHPNELEKAIEDALRNISSGGVMTELTGKERVQKLFRHEPIDRMPCFSGQGTITVQAIEKMGTKFAKVHSDPALMAGAALTSARMWGLDGVAIPFDMATVAEAMGRGISLYDSADGIIYPTVPNKWKDLDEIDIPADFISRGRMPVVDEAFAILKKEAPDLALGAWVLGPFTQAGQIMELDILLKGLKKKKEQIEAFLDQMTRITIDLCKHYESLGVDFITVREMGSGTDLLSPRMWKTLIQPNLTRVFEAISVPSVNHICGSTDLIIEMMNECGADALSVDQKNNVAETRKKLGDDVLILGNFDPYGVLATMEDAAEVETVIKQCIDNGVDAVWPGCDIWPDVKKGNMETYVRTVCEYGKKPSPAGKRI